MFRFKTIRIKIIVLFSSVFIVFLGIHTAYQFKGMQEDAFNILKSVNKTINKVLVEFTSAYIYNKDIKNIQLSIDTIESKYIKSIYILNEDSTIIASKNPQIKELKYTRLQKLLKSPELSIINEDEYIVLTVFEVLDIPIGYMVVEADLSPYKEQIAEENRVHLVEAVLFSFMFFFISILLSRSLSGPIESIVKKLQTVKDEEILSFDIQAQMEFEYLAHIIGDSHNRLRLAKRHLESQVRLKTQELQELNKTLEVKVDNAIEEAAQKGKMLEQQSRMAQMGEMISMIAHQWRQPLGAIAAVAGGIHVKLELENFDLDTPEGQKEFTQELMNNILNINDFVQSLTTTINDFRSFYKPNKQKDLSDINTAVKKGLSIIRGSLAVDKIELCEEYTSVNKLDMYRNELMQVILNIIKNAQDNFLEKGIKSAKIDVKSYDDEDKVVVEITDNGGGISEDILEKIFDPYFSTKDEKNGTGLGLYMSKTIIEEHHNGKFFAENTIDGARFIIELRPDIVEEKKS